MPSSVTLEHYEVLTREDGSLHELGRGAMGITYKAYDTRLCVPVAIKVINSAHLHRDSVRQRFVREARSAAQLRHRNVASIFHLGEDDDGNYFYVMEFIDGETVEALVRRQGPLPAAFALRIVAQVARALNAAQQHDLVHRDIKPSNLMAVVEDDDLVIKVIDFGLAKGLLADGEASAAGLTRGGILGTPQFASPEQLAERETDARSDIYSLGITLWYLLCGATPFGGSVARVVGDQMTKTPPFDDIASLPSVVVDLLRRMLAKDPAKRQQTPAELRKEVEEALRLIEGRPRTPTVVPPTVHSISDSVATATPAAEVRFDPGVTVAGRYRIARELSESEAGRSFLARDTHQDRDVRLLTLHRELLADRDTFLRMEEEVAALTSLEHAHVLPVFGLTSLGNAAFLTLAWTNGYTLRQLLRSRRELPVTEAWTLLEQAASGLDHAAAYLPRLELGLHHVLIHFPAPEVIKEEWLPREVSEWPKFVVKINPLATWREFFAATWTAGQTLVGGLEHHERKSVPGRTGAIQAFGALIYELLGGMAAGFSRRVYTPLAALDETGNAVLQRVLTAPESFSSAADLLQQLSGTSSVPAVPPVAGPKAAAVQRVAKVDASAQTMAPADTEVPFPDEMEPAEPEPAWRRLLLPLAALITITASSYALFRVGSRVHPPSTTLSTPSATITPSPTTPSPTTPRPTVKPSPTAKPTSPIPATPRPITPRPITPRPTTPTPPPATPPPTPTRIELATNARKSAETFEARQKSPEALAGWLRMSREFPEFDAGRQGIQLLLDRLRLRPGGLTKAEFSAMRPDILQSAKLGVVAAMMTLGDALRDSEPAQSFAWYCAAAQSGEPIAMTQAGLMLSNGAGTPRDMRKAAAYFQAATEKGETTGMTALAECYLEGDGVPEDKKQAIALLQRASGKGNVRAKNRLGWCYHKGIGLTSNHREAFRLFSEAADGGFPEAVGNLGVLYMNGEGVEKSVPKALEKFKEASLKDDRNAMLYYARCFENGIGTKPDIAAARAWYQKSAGLGQVEAIEWCKSHGVPLKGR